MGTHDRTRAERLQQLLALSPAENLEECLMRAHAESARAEEGPLFFAWNRVLHALWEVEGLR